MAVKRPDIIIQNNHDLHLKNELFQNITLRPILKLKHKTLIKIFKNQITKSSIKWEQLTHKKKIDFTKNQITKNIQLKNFIIGMVISQMEEAELDKYLISSREFNKRIINMSLQRVISTIS